MSVTAVPTKVVGRILVNNGTTATGAVSTLSVSLGTLNLSAWDDQKAWNIADAYDTIADKSMYTVEKVLTSRLES